MFCKIEVDFAHQMADALDQGQALRDAEPSVGSSDLISMDGHVLS
jgi:hypothetical protein